MKLRYLHRSLEISRQNGWGDGCAMWNISGHPHYPDHTTISLETVKKISAWLKQSRRALEQSKRKERKSS